MCAISLFLFFYFSFFSVISLGVVCKQLVLDVIIESIVL